MDLNYHSGQNEVFFVETEARVLDLWPDETFGPKLPKTTTIHKIFETNSSFHEKQRTTAKV